jgi:Txe/YoeB family toxin of Txe-Axe toxin-antitoxin module
MNIQLKNCIDEYASGVHVGANFSAKAYMKTYQKILTLIDQVKRDPYHGRKFEAMLRRCAELGR